VRDLTQVGDLEAFGRFVRLCAGRAGGLLNLSSLGNDCGVSHDTARRWLSVLEASFVTFRLQPYHRRFNKRLTRRAKLYFVDTGLLCWLLRIRDAGQLATHAARGAVFENLVVAEALKVGCNAGEPPDLYHWRDQRVRTSFLGRRRAARPLTREPRHTPDRLGCGHFTLRVLYPDSATCTATARSGRK
jgi:predicted AAA+ superfamily ATPase